MTYKRSMTQRISDAIGGRISRLGELLDIQYLIYNPLTFWNFQRIALYSAPDVVDIMAKVFPGTRTIIDIGCGGGAYAAEFQARGFEVKALENSRYARSLAANQGVDVYPFDLTINPVTPLQGEFDLAYCFEVAEHIQSELSDKLVAFLCSKSSTCVFSAATPGQLGMGHINCQHPDWWRAKFEREGFALDTHTSAKLKQAFSEAGVAYWLTNNSTVFRRQ